MGFGRFFSQCGATMYREFAVIVREERISNKKAPHTRGLLKIAIGAEDEIRTRDFLLGKEVLYH